MQDQAKGKKCYSSRDRRWPRSFRGQSLAIVLAFLSSAVQAQTIDCSKYLVKDEHKVLTSSYWFQKTKTAFCREQSSSRQTAHDAGVSAGIPVPVLESVFKVELNGSYSDKNWETWRDKYCSLTETEALAMSSLSDVLSSVSDNVTQIVTTCLQNQGGLYGYFVPGKDKKSFSFFVRYKPYTTETAYLVQPVVITPNEAVSQCNPNNLFETKPASLNTNKAAVVAGQSKSCVWDSKKTVHVDVNTDRQAQSFVLDSIDLPPLVSKPNSIKDHLLAGKCTAFATTDLKASGGCVGTILANRTYFLAYSEYNKGWIGYGAHGNGSCPPTNVDFPQANKTYNCPNFSNLCDTTPVQNYIVLWGAAFRFNSLGEVYDGSNLVGRLSPINTSNCFNE